MLNKIIQYSLNNRLLIIIAAVTLLLWGSYTASRMEVDVFPDLNAPTVVVMTEAQGMAPEEVERLVTFPVETAVNGATDVRRVRSSSTTGFSVVWVEFDWGTNIYTARQIVSEKLATLGDALPSTVGQPTLGPQSSILGEMMIIGLTADSTSLQDLRSRLDHPSPSPLNRRCGAGCRHRRRYQRISNTPRSGPDETLQDCFGRNPTRTGKHEPEFDRRYPLRIWK